MGYVCHMINLEAAVDRLLEIMEPDNYEFVRGVSAAIDALKELPCEENEVYIDDGK